ncbi:6-cysteine protein, putative [Plasmodium malariae]|uniref:6-cysteine protein, putative n=1 Tax=Plasmodium malariae TaxID=5858 RepID=A0A1C3KA43_PLAMA|nr:6-cysteine protein, putative [Plasmodium malariae]
MKKLVVFVFVFLFLLKEVLIYAQEHVCDFTKEKYLLGKNEKEYCEVHANPFDSVTFICPEKIGAECFQNVNIVDDITKEKMDSSKISIDEILYGSTVYGDTLLISPTVKKNTTFYCFCNLQTADVQKYLQKRKAEKEKLIKESKSIVVEDSEEEEVLVKEEEEQQKVDEHLEKALQRVKKYKNIIEKEKKKDSGESLEELPEDYEEIVEEEVDEEIKIKTEKIITKYGIMKVVVSTSDTITKGCDFGNNVVNYFSNPYPVEKYGGSRVCRIEAKPGEFVGFKCIYDNTGTVEPNNCFDKVLYEDKETDLKTLMPGYISYGNKRQGKYAFYLKLPHFIQHNYTIRCKCRSTVAQYDNYVFELAVEGGESAAISQTFQD